MPLLRPSLEEVSTRIEKDMESRLTSSLSLLKVALLRVLSKVFAGAIHIAFGFNELVSKQLLPDNASTDLDRHAFIWGVPRKAATFATGQVTFTGDNGSVIPAGTLVQSEGGIEYLTKVQVEIALNEAVVDIEAKEAGEAGNLQADTILQLVVPIDGVADTATSSVLSGGQDSESDENLRSRILERIREQPAGGAARDYIRWSKEVDGVSNAWVKKAFPVPGWVTIIIKASGLVPTPSPVLLQTVKEYLEVRTPAAANIDVLPIVEVSIRLNININPNTADYRTLIIDNIRLLLSEVSEPGKNVLISHLYNAISTTGVKDYAIDYIDKDGVMQPIGDIEIVGYEYPVLGIVTFGSL